MDEWLTLPDVADVLQIEVGKVRQLLRDGALLATRDGDDSPLRVPASFLGEGAVIKGLQGTITLLRDARFTDDEALAWLLKPNDLLGTEPVTALRELRIHEVRRVAMTLGF